MMSLVLLLYLGEVGELDLKMIVKGPPLVIQPHGICPLVKTLYVSEDILL
jgi:hypothetical protein